MNHGRSSFKSTYIHALLFFLGSSFYSAFFGFLLGKELLMSQIFFFFLSIVDTQHSVFFMVIYFAGLSFIVSTRSHRVEVFLCHRRRRRFMHILSSVGLEENSLQSGRNTLLLHHGGHG